MNLEDKVKQLQEWGYEYKGDDFKLLNSIEVTDVDTGVEYNTYWHSLKDGMPPRITTLQWKKEYAESRGYTLLCSENPKTNASIEFESYKDGKIYTTSWGRFLKGTDLVKTTLGWKKKYANERGFELLSDENPKKNSSVTLIRLSDGVEFTCYWNYFEDGTEPSMTTLEGKRTQARLLGYELVDIGENFTVMESVTLRNIETGDEFTTLFNSFINGGVREKARYLNSKGEAVIDSYLRSNLKEGYTVSVHYRLELGDNRGGNVDFAIINSTGEVEAFIEYNGVQHYKVVDYFGEDSCKHTQESDRLKEAYAKGHNIPLLIIPYTIKRKEDIVQYIKENHNWYLKEEYMDFQVVRTNKYMTTLEEKKEQARSVGWELLEEENFVTTTSVKMKHGDEEITRRWDYFLLKEVNKTLGTKL